ncbi:hypothetical protein GQ56_0105760 [Burkholderia paludis]|uniref:TetR/AcrR family transcriptional regulator n=1 Tax=Burkholderia paludis TaxID=1506587 RepID=UPI0004DB7961|nr:hypothetical protein [Burkholderia paludis]KFG98154.1 hypothetical protein GQ56_0105760 [Burkholderia paludis]
MIDIQLEYGCTLSVNGKFQGGALARRIDMSKSREEASQTRKRIVETAARELREKSVAGAGIADIMSAAGLTAGRFYRQGTVRLLRSGRIYWGMKKAAVAVQHDPESPISFKGHRFPPT